MYGELGELGISVCFHLIAAVGGQLCGLRYAA